MRPAIRIASGLALGALFSIPQGTAAQTVPSSYSFIEQRQEVGAFFGYMNANTGRFGYGPSGGLWFGARYGLQLGGPASLETVAGLVSGTRDIVNPNRVEGDRVIGEGDALITTLDARLKFSATGDRAWHGLSPFLVLGAGIAFDIADAPEAEAALEERDVFDFGTSFFGSLGLGTRWFVTDRFTLRTDGTFSLWRIKTPPGFSDTDRDFGLVDETEWVRGLSATASLTYRW
jgi:hypothetical protein